MFFTIYELEEKHHRKCNIYQTQMSEQTIHRYDSREWKYRWTFLFGGAIYILEKELEDCDDFIMEKKTENINEKFSLKNVKKLITAGGDINMIGGPPGDGGGGRTGEKLITPGAHAGNRNQNLSAKIAAAQNGGNYEMFDWRQSNQSLNQESESNQLITSINYFS